MSIKPFYKDDHVVEYEGHVLKVLGQLPAESVHMVVTSIPYWGLRDYGLEPQVWDYGGGLIKCEHKWGDEIERAGSRASDSNPGKLQSVATQNRDNGPMSQFCQKCNAWRGSLGLEPTPELFISHIVQVFRELWRVGRKDCTVWLNIGDSYANSGLASPQLSKSTLTGGKKIHAPQPWKSMKGLKPKDLCMIPARVALALQADGWWLRSDIIWNKPNPMPESCTDRPTKAHEYVFLLTKSGKSQFWAHRDYAGTREKPKADYRWVDQITEEEVSVAPPDWKEVIICPNCEGKGRALVDLSYEFLGVWTEYWAEDECLVCEGKKKIQKWKRINLWKGHDYFYDAIAVRENSNCLSDSSGRADFASFGSSALTPEFPITIYTENVSLNGRGSLDFGKSQITVNDAMTTNTERFQIVNMIGFNIRIEVSKGYFVVNLENHNIIALSTGLTSKIISLQSNLSLGSPVDSLITNLPSSPSGAILTNHISTNPFPCTFTGAKISFMECAFIPENLFIANITMNFQKSCATLFVWSTLSSSHDNVSFYPKDSNSITGNQPNISENRKDLHGPTYSRHRVSIKGGQSLTATAGRNLRSVWTIATEPFPQAHFATFPAKLCEIAIKAGTSERGCCPECGAPWVRVVEKTPIKKGEDYASRMERAENDFTPFHQSNRAESHWQVPIRYDISQSESKTIGWKPSCKHTSFGNEFHGILCKPIPCTVLDPFSGSGRALTTARKLGRKAIGVDLKREYLEMPLEELKRLDRWEKKSFKM